MLKAAPFAGNADVAVIEKSAPKVLLDLLDHEARQGTYLLDAFAEAFPVAFHHAVQDRFLGPVTLGGRVFVKRRMRVDGQAHAERRSALRAARNPRASLVISSADGGWSPPTAMATATPSTYRVFGSEFGVVAMTLNDGDERSATGCDWQQIRNGER
jgi:hypothetical protein